MYCPNCGTRCETNHHFCYLCGTELPILNAEMPNNEPDPIENPATGDVPVPQETAPADVEETAVEEETAAETEPGSAGEAAPEPAAAQPEVIEAPAPKPKKGRIWPPVLALVLMICIGLAVFFLSGGAEAPPAVSATPWFTVEDGVLRFHAELYTGSEELTIPAEVDGQTVTAIADNAFSGCDGITTVILPETVTHIGDYAFSSCHSLRGIYIPETMRTVGMYAFADCTALEAIYVPGTLESMGHGALDSCTSLHFILFGGTYDQWIDLYVGIYASEVELHTIDGTYYAQP